MNEKSPAWTVGTILHWTVGYFQRAGIETPRLDAEVLLAWILKKERIYLYVHFDQPLNADELNAYHNAIQKRAKHIPVAYIIGHKEFMGKNFHVTPAVLIPRPETELLVQVAIDRLRKNVGIYGEAPCIADIGTGSGAIALSVLHYLPQAHADAVDISAEALTVAKENADLLNVLNRVTFYAGNLLEPLQQKNTYYAAILSNPPYIPQNVIADLPADVRLYEPIQALAGGDDGLDFYRNLCVNAPKLLLNGGFFACEVGIGEAQAVAALFEQSELINRVEILPDLAGIERIVIAQRK